MHRVVVIGLLMLQSVRALRLGSHRLALHNGAVSGVARAAGVGRLLSSVEDFFDNDSDSDRFVKRVDRRDRPARETVREDRSYGRGKEGSGARDGSWKQNDGAREYKPRYSAGTSDRHSGSTGGRGAPRPGQNSRPSYGSDRSGAGRDSGYRPAFNRPAGAGAGDNRRPTGGDYGNRSGSFNRFSKYKSDEEKEPPAYGYYDGDHLYGITPVRVALSTGRREIKELLVQSGMEVNNKKDDKFAKEILQLAKEKNIPIREFPKHDLNMLTDSRPHQGFVLRAEPLKFLRINNLEKTDSYQ